jgi:hypothetical protein
MRISRAATVRLPRARKPNGMDRMIPDRDIWRAANQSSNKLNIVRGTSDE